MVATVAHLTRFIPQRVKGRHFDPSAWRHMDRAALKHLLGRIITYAIFLLIIFGILKLVPRIWQDVREGNPLYVALAVPMEVLSIAGYVVLFWAVYGAEVGDLFYIAGFVQGQARSGDGRIASSDIRDFGDAPPPPKAFTGEVAEAFERTRRKLAAAKEGA